MSLLDDTPEVLDDAPAGRAKGRDGSLNRVREIIPPVCYRRSGGRAAVALVQAARREANLPAADVGLAY